MPPKKREGNLDDVRYNVHVVTTLKLPNEDYASQLLHRAVKYGNIILKRHRWTVARVSEFYPRSQNLLGLNENKGEHVKVRLRTPNDKNRFFQFEEVMCTLLHEIVHCTISPHNAAFWKRYHELVEECELLQLEEEGMGPPVVNWDHTPEAAASPQGAAAVVAGPPPPAAPTPFSGAGRVLGGRGGGGGASPSSEEMKQRMLEGLMRRQPRENDSRRTDSTTTPRAGTAVDSGIGSGRRSRLLDVATQREQETDHGDCGMSQRPTVALDPNGDEEDEDWARTLRHLCDDGHRAGADAAGFSGSAGRGGVESESEWACQICGFLNHPLLPYCEACCAEDVVATSPSTATLVPEITPSRAIAPTISAPFPAPPSGSPGTVPVRNGPTAAVDIADNSIVLSPTPSNPLPAAIGVSSKSKNAARQKTRAAGEQVKGDSANDPIEL